MKKSSSNSSLWMRNEKFPESVPLVLKPPKSYGAILPYYQFLKATIKATSNQTLNRSESMVSLCFRSLTSFVLDDNLPGLQAFLENKQVQVDDKDENGTTALMVAASKGRPAFIWELLSHGADPNAEDQDGWSALLCAAKEGYTDICCTLLENGAQIEHRDMGGWTAIMWGSYKGHTDTVILLLDRGADCNAHGNFHISSLLWASGRGHTRIVQELIQRSAKVNVGDKYGTTALVWASRKGHTEIVDILLKAGANVDTAGMYSWTALLVATQQNHVDIVNILLEYKPNVNALDKDGCTALTIACKEGFYEIATALLNANAYINIQDRMGDTNLIHAVKAGHRGIVEALLKKYADVDVCGKDRKTAIYTAVEKGNVAIVKMLLAANPDLEISTKDGDTPLLRAVRSRSADIVQLLLDKRAKVSATDRKGDTVLHIAMRARSKAIVEILLRNPKNSQLLYRPNKQGETAYNIDLNHQKQILGQVFGARRLNTNEDNENMLGYDLYSSALADMLSEPSLSMPITVGLYAKWGSGKSFLLNKLREEMKNFARQWVDPVFHFSSLLFLCVVHISVIGGTLIGIALLNWLIGVVVGATLFLFIYLFLAIVWFLNQRYDWDWPYNFTVSLTRKLNSLRLILQITFCHPPSTNSTDSVTAQPIRFYFTDQTRVSSTTGGENSVVQMLGSLYDAIESNYGAFPTRLYRAFKPKPVKSSSSSWRLRRLCCLPYAVIFELCVLCLLIGLCTLTVYIVMQTKNDDDSKILENISNDSLGTVTLHVVLISIALLLGVTSVANLYTWGRVFVALVFSQRTQLRRAIAKLDTLKSEGFQQTLTQEVLLMKDMVKCLDSLSSQQTRLVVIVDGLDSCEQDKVLLVLDAVHMLFSDTNSPFIVILAIDPHVISKAVEMNSRRLFNESNIGGHDYLRNLVHLPFFLQNSGLRKVKIAQQTAHAQHRKQGGSSSIATATATNTSANNPGNWTDPDDAINFVTGGSNILVRSLSNRRLSTESALMSSCEKLKPPAARKGSRKLKVSESIASSIGSNLNMVVGAHDLTKMLLTDDYFSDVNPRSMRRLMNVVYVTGRLLKAFQIDFNWYHLASWINITEQWPYRTSWIIFHYDLHEDQFDDLTSLKTLYDKVRPKIPTLKEVEPLLELDRDEKKFDIFLTFHRSSLLVSDLKIFLPFTINLDPYIKKVIKEEYQQNFDDDLSYTPTIKTNQWTTTNNSNQMNDWTNTPKSVMLQRRQKQFLRSSIPNVQNVPIYPQLGNNWVHNTQQTWSPVPVPVPVPPPAPYPPIPYSLSAVSSIPSDVLETKLSTLNVNGVCKLFEKIDELNPNSLSQYTNVIKQNNINGRVLLHCDLDELKKLLHMNFGDWEMFRVLIVSLREHELTSVYQQDEGRTLRFTDSRERKSSNPKSHLERDTTNKTITDNVNAIANTNTKPRTSNKQSIMEKQVTLEDQMICGALQTLNEEACEDVLEESIEITDPNIDIPQTTLIPPSPDQQLHQQQSGTESPFEYTSASGARSRTSSTNGTAEADFVILQPATYNKYGWSPVVGVASGSVATLHDNYSQSENSSVSSTPRARRKKDMGLFFQEPKKSVDNSYITIDLKPLVESEIQSKATEHIHSSMYGQNSKHNTPPPPPRPRPSSLLVNKEEVPSSIGPPPLPPSSGSGSGSCSDSTKTKIACVRSKSVEDNNRNNKKKNNFIKVKFIGPGDTQSSTMTLTPTPTTSLEKLTKLKEKLMQASTDNRELPTNILDSDDESTPLVSDMSTPSVSLGPESPPTPAPAPVLIPPKHFQNKAFSPLKSPENSSPSQQFSSPEAEHKNDNNLTDSTDFSPISPIHELVRIHSGGGGGGGGGAQTILDLDYLTPPQSYMQEASVSPSSLTSSNLSLSNYLEASTTNSNSNSNSRKLNQNSSSKSGSLASVASFASDYGKHRKSSNASNLSRQNALDLKEERV